MALAVMLYLPLLFERVRGIRRQDGKHSDEYVKNRVESIYFDVTHFYNSISGEAAAVPEAWPDFDGMYCSDAWNGLLAQMEDGFFDCNYWTGYSGLGFLYVNKVELIDRTGDMATVSMTLHNGDRAVPMLLVMVFERDDWRIDNMTYYWNEKPSTRYYDWRQEMESAKETNSQEKNS